MLYDVVGPVIIIISVINAHLLVRRRPWRLSQVASAPSAIPVRLVLPPQ
jgi:hypothetical protein